MTHAGAPGVALGVPGLSVWVYWPTVALPPALVVATLICVVQDEFAAGDHTIVLLRVLDATSSDADDPLVLPRSTYSKLHRNDRAELQGRINAEPVASPH